MRYLLAVMVIVAGCVVSSGVPQDKSYYAGVAITSASGLGDLTITLRPSLFRLRGWQYEIREDAVLVSRGDAVFYGDAGLILLELGAYGDGVLVGTISAPGETRTLEVRGVDSLGSHEPMSSNLQFVAQ